ncbi:iron ABC transporter ATP-binding protein [Caldimicrobium thiodismutans]|uniref:Iron ABC transporter ATP-binding protein n=1 Tax=Caldimicrobium thiodismutans TaxID=1653476 RepID=A0A0U4W1H9_9BACT|nr:ABC transporter ATP-binding protein [Caldimicrobium thiodismutans]BAU23005.1 iron ABC transporter ATP-binding protein [Caldimicrobium thiodismutans]
MIEVKNLRVFLKKREILKNLSCFFQNNRLYALLGPNGAGKTTFLKTLCGIQSYREGEILIMGRSLKTLSSTERAKIMAYLPQRLNLPPNFSVFESILLGRIPHFFFEPKEEDLNKVEEVIELLNINDFVKRSVRELSGGEFQKVLIGRALAQEPKILLLDEPVNHLDPKNQIEIMELLQKIISIKNILVIMVLHDLNLALRFADNFLFLKDGKLLYEGDSESIDENLLRETFEISGIFLHIENRKFFLIAP